jgi:hypothetical protein
MNVGLPDKMTSIWQEVRQWPPEKRLVLATRILQSLQPGDSFSLTNERKEALRRLIGIWRTDKPPSDEAVEQIVEEERMKKYG